MDFEADSEQQDEQSSGKSMPRVLVLFFVLVTVLLAAAGGYYYLHYERLHPHTDDAYVHAHIVNIASQVSGPVKHLAVHQYDQVRAGTLLFDIDAQSFQLAVQQASDQLLRAKQANVAKQQQVAQAVLAMEQRASELTVAKKNAERMHVLLSKRLVPQATVDKVDSDLQVAQASLLVAQHQWQLVRSQLGGLGYKDPAVHQASVGLAKAKLDLSHTSIYAPADGQVGTLPIRVGSMVSAGVPLFAIVETGLWWVTANFKETQMALIRPGLDVDVQIDFPNVKLKGVVSAVSRGSGSSFSLMPAENATGSWVKVTQRFSVRIALLPTEVQSQKLHDGASAEVVVHANRQSAYHVPSDAKKHVPATPMGPS